jgi:hypothetical protein
MHNLEQLSDYDFEQVVADLLTAEWRVRVETFPRGRDGGVDLRVLGPTPDPLNIPAGKELVVQCKHMPLAGIGQLRRPLKEEAAKKVVNESHRYVLVTSARLTRENKKEIVRIFADRLAVNDIYGRDDVESLIRWHPEVTRAHVKLWLASDASLEAFRNQVEYLRSNALQMELEKLRPRLVHTSVVDKAQQMLGRFGICVLAGAPGVGKTTTGKILLLRYLSEGWRPVVAISDIRELEAQLLPDVKQILFFDDFLGTTGLPSKLARGDDSALVRLIHLIEDDASKAFILTTREYILRQAQQAYEKLNDDAFDMMKVVVSVGSLTRAERAHILYNQLFFSPLRSAATAAPDGALRYMALTVHPNYNPRLIDATISAAVRDIRDGRERFPNLDSQGDAERRREGGLPAHDQGSSTTGSIDIPALLRRSLDHPERLWEHVLLHQLTQLQREILVARLSLGSSEVEITDFLQVASSLASAFGNRPTQLALSMALNILDGDLLSVTREPAASGGLLVHTLNPGVADSVVAMLRKYPEYLEKLIAAANTFEQVRWIAAFLGITRSNSFSVKSAAPLSSAELVSCAERNFLISPVTLSPTLLPLDRPGTFDEFGMRLELLSVIYGSVDQHSSADFGEKVATHFLGNMQKIPGNQLVRTLGALRASVFQQWKSRRTEIRHAILKRLDRPGDIGGWSLLRDALDLIGTTPEYEEKLRGEFKIFLDEWFEEAFSVAEEASDDDSIDLPTDDLADYEELAHRWGVDSSDFADLDTEFERIAEMRDAAEDEEEDQERDRNQLTLFESADNEPEPSSSIFDHL